MPTYVYGCDTCSHRFEIFQKFQDAPLTECPECGARIRRIFQPAGIVFKGSGWYSKDSRSSGQAGTATTSGDAASPKTETAAKTEDGAKTTGAAKDSVSASPAPAKDAG
jgi:putative FmdB family regulatory protein